MTARKTSRRTSRSKGSSTAPRPDVTAHLLDVSRALDALGVRWCVFGAQAVVAAGIPRTTADLDVTVEAEVPASLVSAMRAAGFDVLPLPDLDEFVEQTRVLPFKHRKSSFGLDLVLAGPGFEAEMLSRVIHRKVGRRRVPFIDTNDLLALKILAGRGKDIDDVLMLLRTKSPEIDVDIVRRRLRALEGLLDDSTLVRLFDEQVAVARGPTRRRG